MRTLRIISPLAFAIYGLAQTAPSTILNVEVADHVVYIYDVADYSRLASDPGKTPNPGSSRAFSTFISIGDVVSVNGAPAKGAWVQHATALRLTTALVAGSSIADITRFGLSEWMCEILQPDGTPIGTLMASGTIFGSQSRALP